MKILAIANLAGIGISALGMSLYDSQAAAVVFIVLVTCFLVMSLCDMIFGIFNG